jgi:hypothetical protein
VGRVAGFRGRKRCRLARLWLRPARTFFTAETERHREEKPKSKPESAEGPEWTRYAGIHSPHFGGFLVSRQGEFRLTPLPDGGTRLEATRWYRHHLWPAHHWRCWSDYFIHQLHKMVLENVRERAGA